MRIAIYISISMLFAGVLPLAAQPASTIASESVKWQTLNSKDEFSVAMPEGSKGFTEDNEYSVGQARHRVTKRIFAYRNINGTALISEMFEGDVRGVKDELVSRLSQGRLPYELSKNQDFDGVSVGLYSRRQDRLFSVQQFILFKKRLYVIQAHATDENNSILHQYLRSLGIVAGGKSVMPNLSPGDDVKIAAKPPDIAVSPLTASDNAEPLNGKHDRDVIFLHKPRPRYTSDARAARATGAIQLRVLFSASGKIAKIEVESGPAVLRDSAILAAEQILFIPAEKDGKAVSIWRKVSYSFSTY